MKSLEMGLANGGVVSFCPVCLMCVMVNVIGRPLYRRCKSNINDIGYTGGTVFTVTHLSFA